MSNEQYDELKQELKDLRQTTGIADFNQNKKNNEAKDRLEKLEEDLAHSAEAFTGLLSRLDNYESRIKVLEEARQKQIQLNQSFQLKATSSKPEIKPFWSLFKR